MALLRDRIPALGVAVLVAVAGFAVAGDLVPEAAVAAPCRQLDPPLEVSVSTEKASGDPARPKALDRIAAAYNDRHRTVTVDGVTVCGRVHVTALTSGSVEQALEGGWTDPRLTLGNRLPEVWLPSASIWPQMLAARTGRPVESAGSLAQSPLVLGLPLRKAVALQAHLGGRFDWSLLQRLVGEGNVPLRWGTGVLAGGDPAWGRFHLRKDDPFASTSGLAAVITAYEDLHRSYPGWRIGGADLNRAFRRLEALVSAGGYTSDGTEMMRQLARLDAVERGWGDDTSAVVIQEALLHQYDTHDLAGDAPVTDPEPLVPFYTGSSLGMDHPYLHLPGLGSAGPRRATAEDFAAFLKGPEARAEFGAAGLRDPEGRALSGLTALDAKLQGQFGAAGRRVVPETVRAGDWPGAAQVRQIQQVWKDNRKRAHILVLMDESQSMKGGRMAHAGRALRTALGSWTTSNDRVALWGFSARKGDRTAAVTRPLMDWRPGGASAALDRGIGSLRPRADTPLFRAIAAARTEVARQPSVDADGEWANVVVVMTDGDDDFLEESVEIACAADDDVPVYAIAFDADAARAAADLRTITGRTHGGYQDATNPLAIDRAFSALIRVA